MAQKTDCIVKAAKVGKSKYKNKTEQRIGNLIPVATKRPANYEIEKIPYQHKPSTYLPDFKLANNLYLEVKGMWRGSDRAKHLLVHEQHPDKTIIICFCDPHKKIRKDSSTTYAMYCDKHGIPHCTEETLISTIKQYL